MKFSWSHRYTTQSLWLVTANFLSSIFDILRFLHLFGEHAVLSTQTYTIHFGICVWSLTREHLTTNPFHSYTYCYRLICKNKQLLKWIYFSWQTHDGPTFSQRDIHNGFAVTLTEKSEWTFQFIWTAAQWNYMFALASDNFMNS